MGFRYVEIYPSKRTRKLSDDSDILNSKRKSSRGNNCNLKQIKLEAICNPTDLIEYSQQKYLDLYIKESSDEIISEILLKIMATTNQINLNTIAGKVINRHSFPLSNLKVAIYDADIRQ